MYCGAVNVVVDEKGQDLRLESILSTCILESSSMVYIADMNAEGNIYKQNWGLFDTCSAFYRLL